MTGPSKPPSPFVDPAARGYLLVCLVALLIITLQEMKMGFTVLTPLPLLAGAIGLLIRSSLASLLLLFALGGKIFLEQQIGLGIIAWRFRPTENQVNPSDIILCGAVLAFVMGHYRMMGLIANVFPPDPRRRDGHAAKGGRFGGPIGEVYQRRSTRLVGPFEWSLFVLALPVWPLLAQLLWILRPRAWATPFLPMFLWRWTGLIGPLWIVAGTLWVGSSLLKYWGRRGMTPVEGQMLLQDTLWHETRREQRRVNRWLAWERLRQQREEERA
jgi:hypothetical protein